MPQFQKDTKGFTLLELSIVASLAAMLMALLAPYLLAMRTSWTQIDRRTEMLQHARIGLNLMTKDLRQAIKIISVTSSSDPVGQIVFLDVNGNTKTLKRATVNGLSMLVLDQNGVVSPIAGPIASLTLTAKHRQTLAGTQEPALIKSLDIDMQLVDEEGKVTNLPYTASVYFEKDWIPAFYYGIYAYNNLVLWGTGTVQGDVRANQAVSRFGIQVTGTISQGGGSIPAPTYNIHTLTSLYEQPSAYRPLATTVVSADYTFAKNTTYTGFYYIAAGHSAVIEQNVIINGTVVAEGSVDVQAQHVTITPAAGNPAIVAGNLFTVSKSNAKPFTCNGTLFAKNGITLVGDDAVFKASSGHVVAVGTLGGFSFTGKTLNVAGTLVVGGSANFVFDTSVVVTPSAKYAAVMAQSVSVEGGSFTMTGALVSKGDASFMNTLTSINGVVVSGGTVTMLGNVSALYDAAQLQTPPAYVISQ